MTAAPNVPCLALHPLLPRKAALPHTHTLTHRTAHIICYSAHAKCRVPVGQLAARQSFCCFFGGAGGGGGLTSWKSDCFVKHEVCFHRCVLICMLTIGLERCTEATGVGTTPPRLALKFVRSLRSADVALWWWLEDDYLTNRPLLRCTKTDQPTEMQQDMIQQRVSGAKLKLSIRILSRR